MGKGFDYDEAELDVLDNGGDPDYLQGSASDRDRYLRDMGLRPKDYGGGRWELVSRLSLAGIQ